MVQTVSGEIIGELKIGSQEDVSRCRDSAGELRKPYGWWILCHANCQSVDARHIDVIAPSRNVTADPVE